MLFPLIELSIGFSQVVALYPFQAIEGGDISLEKVQHSLFRAFSDSFPVYRTFKRCCPLSSKEFFKTKGVLDF